jgi:hypothetical protein
VGHLFPNLVYNPWRHEHEPDALVRDIRKASEEARRDLGGEVAAAAKRERVNLDGFVPLATPKAKRSPADVLRRTVSTRGLAATPPRPSTTQSASASSARRR